MRHRCEHAGARGQDPRRVRSVEISEIIENGSVNAARRGSLGVAECGKLPLMTPEETHSAPSIKPPLCVEI